MVGSPERPPNIVYILADDLGYADPSCYGQTAFETPHIDRLAAEGMRFTRHYSGATVCAPSRSAFLEGRHGGHCSVRGNQPPHLTPSDVITLPKALKPVGYVSAVIGKWGVGHFPEPDDPMRCGFDHAFGYVNMWHAHNCFPEFLYRDGLRIELEGNRLDSDHPFDHLPEGTGVAADRAVFAPDLIEAEALAFIEANRNGPFFLYLALNLPHTNGEAARALGDGNEVPDYGLFADRDDWSDADKGFARMVQDVDDTVGRVSAQLERLGLTEQTLLVFSSDNGPHLGGGHDTDYFDSNGILRGHKRDLYEGGLRVPLIARWPGHIQAGSTSDHVSAMWDLMPTFCEAAGTVPPEGLDGISILPTLIGQGKQLTHHHLYWEFYEQGGKQAVLQGNWKAVKTHVRDDEPVVLELFNLKTDPTETQNLVDAHPEIALRLVLLMEEAHEPIETMSLFTRDL
jgi:arylsulfatase A-like enzyme